MHMVTSVQVAEYEFVFYVHMYFRQRIASLVLSGKISTDFDVQTSFGNDTAEISFSIENVSIDYASI